jgi:ectoine hydroxylase-related dioxygenase (phytanoyl-CoA dioxygenase family)
MQRAAMVESRLAEGDVALRRRLADDGFLLMRGVVSDGVVHELQAAARRAAIDAGLNAPDGRFHRRENGGDVPVAVNKSVELLRASLEFQRAKKAACLRPVLEAIGAIGPHPASHASFARFVPPFDDAGRMSAHQDQHYVPKPFHFVTLWVPILMPSAAGGIAVAAGSHRGGPVKHVDGRVAQLPTAWRIAKYAPGDVVVLGAYTIHKSLGNRASSIRVSADFRFVLKRANR